MALASTLELDALLRRVVDISREVIGCSYAALGVLGEGGALSRFVFSGLDEATADRIGTLPEGKGVLGVIIEEGRPLRLREIADHPRSVGFPAHHPEMHSFLGVPIVARGRIFGRLYLTNKIGAAKFSEDDEHVALLFAAQAGVAIENARLQGEVLARTEEVAVLRERERIAKELHDGVIQSIYSVGLSLQGAASFRERDAARARARIDEAIAELDNVIRDVRSYIFELQPYGLEGKRLVVAVKELARDFEVNTLARASVEIDEAACDAIPRENQVHVIQIVREVLSNIARHAQASEVSVRFADEGGSVVLTIEDDGVGFDPKSVRRGHGLRNIEERAKTLGGTFEIKPRRPKGTRHLLRIAAPEQEDR